MEGLPEEIVHFDLNTFPREDPRVVEATAKATKAAEKQAADEARREQAAVRKMQQMMAGKQKEEEAETEQEKPKRGGAKKPAAAAPNAAKKAAEDAKRCKLKLQKCKLYFQKFSEKLSIKEPRAYPKDEPGLDELLAEIEAELQSAGGIKNASLMFLTGVSTIEETTKVFNPMGWQLSGPVASLSQTVAANRDQWEDVVTEFAIANAEWFMIGPGKRLLLMTVQLITAVDRANKAGVAQRAQQQASENLQREAAEL